MPEISLFLSDLLKDKKTVLFCGAGISFNSGIPTVLPLLNYLFKKLEINEDDISQYLKLEVPFEVTMEVIADFVSINSALNVFNLKQPNLNHRLIAQLILTGNLKVVITTNFDENIEFALKELGLKKGQDFKVFSNIFHLPNDFLNHNCPVIIKLHGTISENNSIVTLMRTIASKQLIDSVHRCLKELFIQSDWKNMLFWGYSFSDKFDVNPSMDLLDKSQKYKYCINHSVNKNEESSNSLDLHSKLNDFEITHIITCNSNEVFSSILTKYSNKNFGKISSSSWKKKIDEWHLKTIDDKVLGNNALLAANLFIRCGLLDNSIKYIKKTIESPIAERNYLIKAEMMNKLAAIHFQHASFSNNKEGFELALKYFSEARDLAEKNSDFFNYHVYVGGNGQALYKLKKFEEAEKNLLAALNYMGLIIDKKIVGDGYMAPKHYCGFFFALGALYRTQGKYFEKAKYHYTEAIKYANANGFIDIVELSNFGLGLLFYSQSLFQEAVLYFRNSYAISKKLVSINRLFYNFIDLCKSVYEATNEIDAEEFYESEIIFIRQFHPQMPALSEIISQKIIIE